MRRPEPDPSITMRRKIPREDAEGREGRPGPVPEEGDPDLRPVVEVEEVRHGYVVPQAPRRGGSRRPCAPGRSRPRRPRRRGGASPRRRRRSRPRGCGEHLGLPERAGHQLEERDPRDEPDVAGDPRDEDRLLQDERHDGEGRRADRLADPISFVRSLTAIIMMFETPTTPARSVPMPMTQTNARMPPIRSTNRWNSTTALEMKTARLSSGSKSCRSATLSLQVGRDRLALVDRGVADRHHDHRDVVRAAVGPLGGRDRDVDLLLLPLAADVGEDPDDLERDSLDLEVLADGRRPLEELGLHPLRR